VDAERAPHDQVFTRIHLTYRVSEGNSARASSVRSAFKEKYCSATLMLAKTAAISFEIVLDEVRTADSV
jgi:putative redox protein